MCPFLLLGAPANQGKPHKPRIPNICDAPHTSGGSGGQAQGSSLPAKGRAPHSPSRHRPNSNGPKRRGVILGRRQRPWAIGARPQRGRPDGAQAGPRHGNTAPGESVRAIAQRFRGGPFGPGRAEEARWGVNFQLHLLPVRIMCEDKCRTYQRFLDEQTASSLSLRHLRTVTRPAFRSEPGGSRHCDGDTGLAIAKHRDGCVVPERRWAARISACCDYLKTAAALRGVAGPVALWAGGREAAGGISRL